MAAKYTEITIVINRLRLEDIEPVEQTRIQNARKALARHVGAKIHAKVNGGNYDKHPATDSM